MAKHVAGGAVGIGSLGHDLHVVLALEHHPDTVADELVVVGQDHGDRVGTA